MDVFRYVVLFSLLAMYVITYLPANRLLAVDMHVLEHSNAQFNGG